MIIATAGHIDHGKTTLVRALTGVDTDRLPEEKNRGMTIDLGFAYKPLEDGPVLGFVDVPGHERFVRNMVAGVAGIDFALLVIAADDGPMAQTQEHLSILDLVGVTLGAVALTKTDLVDEARVAAVTGEIENLLIGTGLAGAPIFATAAAPDEGVSGAGIAALGTHLETTARALAARRTRGHFRLAIDRRFNVAGAGLVVTGTAFAGQVAVGDQLVISPAGTPVRVRSIHAQNQRGEAGLAGQRLGVNVTGTGLNRAGVERGDWLVAADSHSPTRRLDCRVRLLAGEPRTLRHWAPVHVHLGAAEVTAHIAILDARNIAPGGSAMAQLVLDQDIGALKGDRLILRDASAQRTIGGGVVLDPFGPQRGRAKPRRLEILAAMDGDNPSAILATLLELSPLGIDEARFRIAWNMTEAEMATLLADFDAVRGGGAIFSAAAWAELCARTTSALDRVHEENPAEPGLAAQSLRKLVDPAIPPSLFRALTERLVATGALMQVGARLARPGHRAQMSEADEALWGKIKAILAAEPFSPPVVHALAEELGREPREIERFLGGVARLGYLDRTARNRFFLASAVTELARIAEGLAASEGKLEIPTFRAMTDIGRNLAVELLEYFDKKGLTVRDGNSRRVVAPAARIFPDI